MLWKWRSTVRTLRCRAAAISSLPRPLAARDRTSRSRGDSASAEPAGDAVARSGGEEGLDLADEDGPGDLVAQHDVVVALQRHEARPGDGAPRGSGPS